MPRAIYVVFERVKLFRVVCKTYCRAGMRGMILFIYAVQQSPFQDEETDTISPALPLPTGAKFW